MCQPIAVRIYMTLTRSGASVSATFLFIVGLANSIILYKTLRRRRDRARAELAGIYEDEEERPNTIMMRILGPVVRFVNKPWKVGNNLLYGVIQHSRLHRCIPSGCSSVSVRVYRVATLRPQLESWNRRI